MYKGVEARSKTLGNYIKMGVFVMNMRVARNVSEELEGTILISARCTGRPLFNTSAGLFL